MICPSFITRITSASRIVDSLCATINVVLPFISAAKASCIFISVLVSMDEVASSSISIGGLHNITLAIQRSCFCPWERPPPSSVIQVSYPFGRRLIKLCTWEAFAASTISSSVASGRPMVILSRIVPVLSHVSWSTIPYPPRRLFRVISRISISSTEIAPESTS